MLARLFATAPSPSPPIGAAQADFREAFDDAYRLWERSFEVDDLFVDCFTNFSEWTRNETSLSTMECLFLAEVGARRGEYAAAALLYMRALKQGGQEVCCHPAFEAIEYCLPLIEPPTTIDDVLKMDIEAAANVINAALKRAWQVDATTAAELLTPDTSDKAMDTCKDLRDVKRSKSIWTLLEMGSYVFEKVQERNLWGDEYRIQKALYWANAMWMFRTKKCITEDAPLCFQNGPLYWDVYEAVKVWKRNPAALPRRTDTEKDLMSVLDAAIAHVCEGKWEEVCEETHGESPWKRAGYRAPITEALMREAYAVDVMPATLARIFGNPATVGATTSADGTTST